MTAAEREAAFALLTDEYQSYCDERGLPAESADELVLRELLTDEQRSYVSDFILRWEAVEDAEDGR